MVYELNLIVIIIATVINVAIGAFWYSPLLFGNLWMDKMGMTKKDAEKEKANMPKYMILAGLNMLVISTVTATLIILTNVTTPINGLIVGCLLWLGYSVTTIVSSAIWEKKDLTVCIINAGCFLVVIAVDALLFSFV